MIKVEVVMRKEMDIDEYKKMIQAAQSKGWTISAYEIGFFSDGCRKKIENKE